MYGIPNMKLPKDVVERRVALMERGGVELRLGTDVTEDGVAREILSTHDAVVAAVGAGKARTPQVPGADLAGVTLAVDYLSAATKALLDGGEPEVSARGLDVVVIGGGDTGTDCVATALRQGAASVTQLEFLPEPPAARTAGNGWPEWPNVRKDDYGQLEAAFVHGRDPRQWATQTLEVLGRDGVVCGLRVVGLDWSSGSPVARPDTERTIAASLVLVAMGFEGAEQGVLDALGVGESPAVFVAGDARTGPSLVVRAIADGLDCAGRVASFVGL